MRWKAMLQNNLILLSTFIGIAVGIILGVMLNFFTVPEHVLLWIGLPGELFIRSLNFAVIPLITTNIMSMSSKLKPSVQGKMALLALGYCVSMNICGAFLGLGITALIDPGGRFTTSVEKSSGLSKVSRKVEISDVFLDFFRNMIPDNIIRMFLFSIVTTYEPVESLPNSNGNSSSTITYKRVIEHAAQTNILGLFTTSLVIGLVAGSRREKLRPPIALFECISEVMTIIIEFIIKLLPIAMISLIAYAIARMERIGDNFIALILFVASSITFLSIIVLVIMPVFFFIAVRRNLFRFYYYLSEPILTAFSSTSSLIALPQLFQVCDLYGIESDLVRTVAPFLTSFNANGSAAFIASAVCFVAQLTKQRLNAGQFIAIGFLSGVNVMALPAIPSASIITVILITRAFDISESTSVSLLFVTEFIVDRLRTVVNVMSHGTCVLFIHMKLHQVSSTSNNQNHLIQTTEVIKDSASSNNVL
ncbi:hypothetical protein MS3_00005205 [Schistosoma haematobium]|uniref:Amino acid transporter n=1 Tax=Schistosoma haematobium TaxID=6185 RepID=A0A922RZR6_SCHHA|nr:hypothetical protein MS3_00005205 [Schistosoma haematobium]KAH9587483.1 hypothetical protein MS3_00005205 [Schistosoma haematobium]